MMFDSNRSLNDRPDPAPASNSETKAVFQSGIAARGTGGAPCSQKALP